MRSHLTAVSRRYQVALQRHLKHGPGASLRPALRVGQQMVALGVETLALARIHERALVSLSLTGGGEPQARRAEIFFAAANVAIEETHQSAAQRTGEKLHPDRTVVAGLTQLAAVTRNARSPKPRPRKAACAAGQGPAASPALLQESLKVQELLRQLMRRSFSRQEQERHAISHHLQDEIAQTLLSIQVRLVNLRTAARGSKSDLMKEIARTQRLVEQSVSSINRFAGELSAGQRAQNKRLDAFPDDDAIGT